MDVKQQRQEHLLRELEHHLNKRTQFKKRYNRNKASVLDIEKEKDRNNKRLLNFSSNCKFFFFLFFFFLSFFFCLFVFVFLLVYFYFYLFHILLLLNVKSVFFSIVPELEKVIRQILSNPNTHIPIDVCSITRR